LPKYINWLINTGQTLHTSDSKPVRVFEFRYNKDEDTLSEWAAHFRNHYCADNEIDILRKGTGLSRSEYLKQIKFPSLSTTLGPSIRAGDFGEILVADYLEFLMGFWVPRSRYCDKAARDESTKGSDILGFKIIKSGKESINDTLAIYETKTQFSRGRANGRLQEAVDSSAKDVTRKAESLNAIKQGFLKTRQINLMLRIERFQNPADHPYTEVSGAVALFSTICYTPECADNVNSSNHPNKDNLVMIVIHGKDMMGLVNELYRRAADEA
jgi:hypothetical protein